MTPLWTYKFDTIFPSKNLDNIFPVERESMALGLYLRRKFLIEKINALRKLVNKEDYAQ